MDLYVLLGTYFYRYANLIFSDIRTSVAHTFSRELPSTIYAQELVVKLAALHAHLLFPQAAFPLVIDGDGHNVHYSALAVS